MADRVRELEQALAFYADRDRYRSAKARTQLVADGGLTARVAMYGADGVYELLVSRAPWYGQGMTPQEVARAMSRPLDTVQRALVALRDQGRVKMVRRDEGTAYRPVVADG